MSQTGLLKHPRETTHVGAGGRTIPRHGRANVALIPEGGGIIANIFQVADVTRPLHSVSKITDNEKEVLFMKGSAVVVLCNYYGSPMGLL